MAKTIEGKLIDFIEWEFNVEITPKLETGIDVLALLIRAAKERSEEVQEEILDED